MKKSEKAYKELINLGIKKELAIEYSQLPSKKVDKILNKKMIEIENKILNKSRTEKYNIFRELFNSKKSSEYRSYKKYKNENIITTIINKFTEIKPPRKKAQKTNKKYLSNYTYLIEYKVRVNGISVIDHATVTSSTKLKDKEVKEKILSIFEQDRAKQYVEKELIKSSIKITDTLIKGV